MTLEPRPRVEVLDPLRALASLAVAWFHFTHGGMRIEAVWLKSSGAYGWLGVEAFFVISGFVIPLSLYRGRYRLRSHFLTFVAKRVVRLDPPYIATILLIIGLAYASAMAPGFSGQPLELSWRIVLLHLGYLNAFAGEPWLNLVFWTLAVEFQFYVVIALAFPLLAAVPRPYRGASAVALGALAFLWPDPRHVVHYLPLFAMGLATYEYHVGHLSRTNHLLTLAALALVGAAALGGAVVAVGVATALVVAFADVRVPRWMSGLGLLSYSLYLVHVPVGGRVVNLGGRYAETLPAQLAILAAAFGLSLAAAYVMYGMVERPSQRWSSAFQYRSVPAVATGFETMAPAHAPSGHTAAGTDDPAE